jgi:hypothetical protein
LKTQLQLVVIIIIANTLHKGDKRDDDDGDVDDHNNNKTMENSHIGHCIHTSETTNVRAQNIRHGK